MNVNNGHYYNYYADKKKRNQKKPVQTPIEKEPDLLDEITIIANTIDKRLSFIEQLQLG